MSTLECPHCGKLIKFSAFPETVRPSSPNARLDDHPWPPGFRKRIRDLADTEGLVTFADLTRLTRIEMMRCPNLGIRTIDMLAGALAQLGLGFANYEDRL